MSTTALATAPQAPLAPRPHAHAWRTVSSHPTSEGIVSYVRCGRCGAQQVRLRRLAAAEPVGDAQRGR